MCKYCWCSSFYRLYCDNMEVTGISSIDSSMVTINKKLVDVGMCGLVQR
jgi:hypothetical protein